MPDTTTILSGAVLPLQAGRGLETVAAIAVDGKTIRGTGSPADLAVSGATRLLDFGSRTVMPGFIDTHTHAAQGSVGATTMVNCVDGCESVADMQQILSDRRQDRAEEWLIARGPLFVDRRWTDGRHPTCADLDKVSTKHPIALQTGHLTILNSRGLETIDIDRLRRVRHGSNGPVHVQVGSDGQPNGLVHNMDSLLPLPVPTRSEVKAAVEDGVRRRYTAHGVTTLCEMSDTRDSLTSLVELIDGERLGTRFSIFLMVPATLTLQEAISWRDHGIEDRPGMLDIRGVKMFGDGGYSSSDAAVNVPYTDEVTLEKGSRGVLSFTDEELAEVLSALAASNTQLALHTNGERAQAQLGRVAASLGLAGQGKPIRLEHGGNWMWDPATPNHWRAGGAVPVPQPSFLYTMAAGMPHYLGNYALQRGRLPFRTLIEDGWELAAGSDWIWSFEEKITNPFFSLWCCMKREGFDGAVIDADEALDLECALRMHTINGARLLGEGDNRGTLERGKLADLVVLDRDITAGVNADNVRDVQVDHVYVGGRLVHSRAGAEPPVESIR